MACLEVNEGRNLITLEDGQFPTDSYIADGLSQLSVLIGRTQAVDIAALTPETLSESAVCCCLTSTINRALFEI